MAAGKSTVGRLLADRLGWEFLDFDGAILERTGRTAGEIIREDGEAAFRALEAELTHALAGRSRVVIAPGGGWGADPDNARRLGSDTTSVWLRIPVEEALRRAERDGRRGIERPLLDGAGEADRLRRARGLLAKRERAYAAAELAVDVNGKEPEAIVDEILKGLGRKDDG